MTLVYSKGVVGISGWTDWERRKHPECHSTLVVVSAELSRDMTVRAPEAPFPPEIP